MKKKIFILLILLLTTGCNFSYEFTTEDTVYTTFYPIEYATDNLYSEYSTVKSIYPNGANKEYKITSKKEEKYALSNIFIYSGVANEATVARDLLNINKNLKIIDATKGMNINYSIEELWLDPSNYLMLCSNIKNSLIEYNDGNYETIKTIEDNYDILNEKISLLDVALYNLGKNGTYNTILTTNNVFTYLTKYNINVITIDEENDTLDKNYSDARNQIASKKIEYIYLLSGEKLSDEQEKFIAENSIVKIEINDLFSQSDEEVENEKDYITLMNEIIEEYKRELYK